MKNKYILNELLEYQLRNIMPTKRFHYKDLVRIARHIDTSIFSDEECSIWTGYITNEKNSRKGMYINFFFNGKKIALHRLLYANFVGNIDDNEYLKFSCDNKGKCCNINHLIKYTKNIYDESESGAVNKKENEKTDINTLPDILDTLTISFD